jgi:hypothetical protein
MLKLIFIILLSGFITYMFAISGSVRHGTSFRDFSEGPEIIMGNPVAYGILFGVILFFFYKKEFKDKKSDRKQHPAAKKKRRTEEAHEVVDKHQMKKAEDNFDEEISIVQTEDFVQAESARKILDDNGLYAFVRCTQGPMGMPRYSLSVLKKDSQLALKMIGQKNSTLRT